MSVSLKDVPRLVSSREIFQCNRTLYSTVQGNLYVVYSYGRHFPIAAAPLFGGRWYVNTGKYSTTTSRHQTVVQRGIPLFYRRNVNLEELNQYIAADGNLARLVEETGSDLRVIVGSPWPKFAMEENSYVDA